MGVLIALAPKQCRRQGSRGGNNCVTVNTQTTKRNQQSSERRDRVMSGKEGWKDEYKVEVAACRPQRSCRGQSVPASLLDDAAMEWMSIYNHYHTFRVVMKGWRVVICKHFHSSDLTA